MANGIALHIGVNRVDPRAYPLRPEYSGRHYAIVNEKKPPVSFDGWFNVGWVGPLSTCEMDAAAMYDLAKSQGFNATILSTPEATAENVEEAIRSAGQQLAAGDTFLVSYSGHGAQVDDLSGDEVDGEDETWCLYDRMFLDDEQRELYAEFAEGVKIVVVSDSCHSGSASRSGKSNTYEEHRRYEHGEPRKMEERTAVDVYRGRKNDYDKIQRDLKHPPPKLKASRILFSACQDHETAMGYDDGGAFTVALLKVWDNGNFTGNYGDLARQTRNELQTSYNYWVDKKGGDASKIHLQVPNFVRIEGSSPEALEEFINQRPFSL